MAHVSRTRIVVSLHQTPADFNRRVFYSILRAGHLIGGPDHQISRDRYRGHEILYCVKGRGKVRIKDRWLSLEGGEIIWIDCSSSHAYLADENDPWELYWIRFEGPQVDMIYTILSSDPRIRLPQETVPVIEAIFERIFSLLQPARSDCAAWVHVEMARLIAHFCDAGTKGGGDNREVFLPQNLRRTLDWMRQHYFEPLRVSALAAKAGMSSTHFARSFKKMVGTSPIDWLRRERVNQAKRQLIETQSSIKQIAEAIGYSDQFFFSRDFKHLTGMNPSEYRKRERLGG